MLPPWVATLLFLAGASGTAFALWEPAALREPAVVRDAAAAQVEGGVTAAPRETSATPRDLLHPPAPVERAAAPAVEAKPIVASPAQPEPPAPPPVAEASPPVPRAPTVTLLPLPPGLGAFGAPRF
jgi:hypothetical protein